MRSVAGIAILGSLFLAIPAMADNEDLAKARELFHKQQYVEAQEALLKVERAKLSEDEAKEYDRLLDLAPTAIQGQKKAQQDAADADKAYDQGRWDEADRLYQAVESNDYATASMKGTASRQRGMIKEKRQLSDAAKPSGPATTAEPQTAPPAAQTADEQPPPIAETGAQPASVVDEMRQRDDLHWQRAVAQMIERTQLANQAVAEDRFNDARELAAGALQVIEASRMYAQPPSRYEAARTQALDLQRQINDAIDAKLIEQAAAEREQIAERLRERRETLERQRQETIEQLLNTGKQLAKQQRYSEAAEAMRQIVAIEPSHAMARNNLEIYEDFSSLYEQKRINSDYSRQYQQLLLENEETKVPWTQDVLYPKNWLEISARRDRSGAGAVADEDSELHGRLEELQADIRFDQEPLDKVMEKLREQSKINLAVDWEDLAANGIERERPISMKFKDVTLRTALQQVLDQVGGEARLGFTTDGGVLRIASHAKLSRDKHILVYDIRDLIVNVPKFDKAPIMEGPGWTISGSRSNDIFDDAQLSSSFDASEDSASPGSIPRDVAKSTSLLAGEVMDIIRTTVSPDSWREAGGDGALRELNGQLIVYNTSDSHRQVQDLLSQLRATRALMIGVEARFLIVTANFLEEIGVDLDFVFNSGNAGFDRGFTGAGAPLVDPFTGANVLVPRQFSRIGATPVVPPFGNPNTAGGILQPYGQAGFVPAPGGVIPSIREMTPITAQQGSLGLVDPTTLNTGIPGSIAQNANFDSALNIAGSFLDNLQVDFLIRATQANRRSSIVQAPKLMLFNGQRAWVAVTRTRQYVGSVTPVVAEAAVGVQPIINNIASGTVLDIEGTIDAEKKYVTLTVRTGLADEPDIQRFEVQGRSGPSPSIFVGLTDQTRRVIRTTVSVPDGGTVLIGGLKQVGEIEIDAGVPILSKIPILKRAFTNTTTVKDTSTLLILIKSKILIQQEAEEEAFPTLSSVGS